MGGSYNKIANTQYNIQLGFLPSYFYGYWVATPDYIIDYYGSGNIRIWNGSTGFDTASQSMNISATGITSNFPTSNGWYTEAVVLNYVACR